MRYSKFTRCLWAPTNISIFRSVKSGIQGAADYAIAKGADVLLFGHTHEAFDEQIDGSAGGSVRCINPGAVGAWYGASFALLEIRDGNLICNLCGGD